MLWLRADKYDKGRFGALLAKSAAPYSALTATELAAYAATIDRRVVVVIDGFNECPEKLRPELLEQVSVKGTFTRPPTLTCAHALGQVVCLWPCRSSTVSPVAPSG